MQIKLKRIEIEKKIFIEVQNFYFCIKKQNTIHFGFYKSLG